MFVTSINYLNNALLKLSLKDRCDINFYNYPDPITRLDSEIMVATVNFYTDFENMLAIARHIVTTARDESETVHFTLNYVNDLSSFNIVYYEDDEEGNTILRHVCTVKHPH